MLGTTETSELQAFQPHGGPDTGQEGRTFDSSQHPLEKVQGMEKDRKETQTAQTKLGCLLSGPCSYATGPFCTYPGIIKIDDKGKCKMKPKEISE